LTGLSFQSILLQALEKRGPVSERLKEQPRESSPLIFHRLQIMYMFVFYTTMNDMGAA